ncbi:MAG TPA: phosphoribosylformylglycinamidine synthase subunit PurQ [Stackebrandtia sp.]|uniref:phosphoribosylformylglycinamidine synthase subunit PurQ n=1 Tax=Stackebrandtia sp. TaxID=2023065 RepID=UPI002D323C64|nr:phosphoribosylformylglycinamidine synthase subunit PurQ [Stackebrandtia sp.]HZE38727.1 phosphoribosylformylglycinamidine synthase subunit PurQ [Stackebrandtia sp.]
MSARIGVVTFPGSLDDVDTARAIARAGGTPVSLWHDDSALRGVNAVVLPGGFSYGDYLRCGAIARFSAVMETIVEVAQAGMPVLGICNGFQILCESHLLPGALVRNAHRRYRLADQALEVARVDTAWTGDLAAGDRVVIPVKHGEGRYVADAATLEELESGGRVVVRYADGNPNGSLNDIAGVSNAAGNVVGMMPHPEHAIDQRTGPSADGLRLFTSVLSTLGVNL